jgi:hypothetical protein
LFQKFVNTNSIYAFHANSSFEGKFSIATVF